MPDNLNMDDINEARRKAIAGSIHTISAEEMKSLGDGLFPIHDHPWREAFFKFVQENAGATFYHANAGDNIHILYCGSPERGIWFTPGSGMGPLQAGGLAIMKQLVAGK